MMARVLVVDDQSSVLLMLESLLLKQGHAVTCVTNAIDAMEKLNNYPFDMMITDLVMPGGPSGTDLIKTVRADKRFAVLPIVMLSGRREKKDIEKGVSAGADDYIVKPVDPDLFLVKIDSLLLRKAPHSVNFVECAAWEPFQWEMMNEITRVSEIGLTLQSSFPVEVGAKLKIKSAFLEKLGLHTLQIRVVSCEKAKAALQYYIIKTHFIGLTESSLQPLRLWVRSNQIKSA